MTNYFSHDFDSLNDVKLQEVLMQMGQEGIGIFWSLVEIMYKQGGRLELEKCTSYAFALHTDSTKINQLISIVFEKDDKYFWSNSVLKRIKLMEERVKAKKKAAKKRWENEAKNSSTQGNAHALQTHSTSNANKRKEKKINKIKEKSIYSTPQILDDEYFKSELKEQFLDKDVDLELEKMKDWLASSGSKKKDYGAFARNWLRKSDGGNSGKLREVIIRPPTEVQV